MAFRYYDSAAGRFLNRDPIGYAGGIDVYSYVGNDPAGASDPSGLVTVVVWINSITRLGWGMVYADPGDIYFTPGWPIPIMHVVPGEPPVRPPPGRGPHDPPVGSIPVYGPFPVGNHVPNPGADPRSNGGNGPFPPGDWPILPPRRSRHRKSMGPWYIPVGRPQDPPGYRYCRMHSGEGNRWWFPTNGCDRCQQDPIDFIGIMLNLNPRSGRLEQWQLPWLF